MNNYFEITNKQFPVYIYDNIYLNTLDDLSTYVYIILDDFVKFSRNDIRQCFDIKFIVKLLMYLHNGEITNTDEELIGFSDSLFELEIDKYIKRFCDVIKFIKEHCLNLRFTSFNKPEYFYILFCAIDYCYYHNIIINTRKISNLEKLSSGYISIDMIINNIS